MKLLKQAAVLAAVLATVPAFASAQGIIMTDASAYDTLQVDISAPGVPEPGATEASIPASESQQADIPTEVPGAIEAYESFGGVYHTYIYEPGVRTNAPKGYRPFYISHVGRHGSRYPVDRGYVHNGLNPLRECAQNGLLTPEGQNLLRGFEKLDSLSEGVYGFLCAEGAAEHKAIAGRMASNFPEVFAAGQHAKKTNSRRENARNADMKRADAEMTAGAQRSLAGRACARSAETGRACARDSVTVQSTHRQRCLMSSWNFCTVLAARYPGLRMGLLSGEKYYDILSNAETPGIKARNKIYNNYSTQFTESHYDCRPMLLRLFTDPDRALALFPNARMLMETCYANGAVALYLGVPEILESITPGEFEEAARNYAAKMNCQHCGSAENGEFRVRFAAPLLRDFLEKADAALEPGSRIAADLRFSHDTGLMPFFALIGLDGYDRGYTFEEAFENWDSTRLMCMATNLQMVFYRGTEGGTLVKILLNERETPIPALGEGPYYEWEALKGYLSAILEKVSR